MECDHPVTLALVGGKQGQGPSLDWNRLPGLVTEYPCDVGFLKSWLTQRISATQGSRILRVHVICTGKQDSRTGYLYFDKSTNLIQMTDEIMRYIKKLLKEVCPEVT